MRVLNPNMLSKAAANSVKAAGNYAAKSSKETEEHIKTILENAENAYTHGLKNAGVAQKDLLVKSQKAKKLLKKGQKVSAKRVVKTQKATEHALRSMHALPPNPAKKIVLISALGALGISGILYMIGKQQARNDIRSYYAAWNNLDHEE